MGSLHRCSVVDKSANCRRIVSVRRKSLKSSGLGGKRQLIAGLFNGAVRNEPVKCAVERVIPRQQQCNQDEFFEMRLPRHSVDAFLQL